MGLGGISDEALLKSGEEALAIGFPLDGPVHDAALLCLLVMRHAHVVIHKPRYIAFLERVQARYPEQYEELAEQFVERLTKRSVEFGAIPPLLLASHAT